MSGAIDRDAVLRAIQRVVCALGPTGKTRLAFLAELIGDMPSITATTATPEFLPTHADRVVRVAAVNDAFLEGGGVRLYEGFDDGDSVFVTQPFAAAWIARLGLPAPQDRA